MYKHGYGKALVMWLYDDTLLILLICACKATPGTALPSPVVLDRTSKEAEKRKKGFNHLSRPLKTPMASVFISRAS